MAISLMRSANIEPESFLVENNTNVLSFGGGDDDEIEGDWDDEDDEDFDDQLDAESDLHDMQTGNDADAPDPDDDDHLPDDDLQ
ncbi:hypothetical protein [Mucilaginibacter ginsenosidivorax]|uniref:Uncharacterized protein n=1 Tax=Mucilaginibacter ginsenosidivorax TaxID=862126 RepID=A0A5B8W4V9_9SPHI|nr:hypothetical protein [Mucilaginibacter ginsenosidivorax]QEC78015.1 hypothetical protein FSB76_19495 [Mucilaginibacter ginsenosidivorax]